MKTKLTLLFFLFGYLTAHGQTFTDHLAETGLISTNIVSILDYNNDGFEDLLIAKTLGGVALYRNNSNGTFTDVTAETHIPSNLTTDNIVFFDANNDGYPDLLEHSKRLINNDSLKIYINQAGIFVDKTIEFGIVNPIPNLISPLCPIDYNNDGWLDLVYSKANVTGSTCTGGAICILINQLKLPQPAFNQSLTIDSFGANQYPCGIQTTDYNNDQKIDILLVVQTGVQGGYGIHPIKVYKNNGNSTFTLDPNTLLSNVSSQNFITNCDLNYDGWLDYINGTDDCCGPMKNAVWQNNGNGTFTEVTSLYNTYQGSNYYGTIEAVDFNNDGNVDISHNSRRYSNNIWENVGGTLTERSSTYGLKYNFSGWHYSSWFDYNNDGALDYIFCSFEYSTWTPLVNSVMQNPITDNHYLRIKTIGQISPRDGHGTRVIVQTGTKKQTQFYGRNISNNRSGIYHFGLGSLTKADSVIVYWPSGLITRMANISTDQTLVVNEGHVISTPAQTIQRTYDFDLPVRTTALYTAQNILSYQFDLNYDSTKLVYKSVTLGGTLSSSGSVLVNSLSPGHLVVGYSSAIPLDGTGDLCKLQFTTLSHGTATPFISNFLYNNNPVAEITNGALLIVDTIPPTAAITYSDPDGILRVGDPMVITATFSEPLAGGLLPQLLLSGANNLAATNLNKVSNTVYTYNYTVHNGNGDVNVTLATATDPAGNPVVSTPTTGASFSVIPLRDGDVDDDGNIYAYDAALVLQYLVNISPVPCPLPWEPWRLLTADVDNDPGITPLDASMILQKAINLITTFPVLRSATTSDADVQITVSDSKIIFRSLGNLLGLKAVVNSNYQLLGTPTVSAPAMLSAFNINASNFKIGLATAVSPSAGTIILQIPYQSNEPTEVTFDLVINKDLVTRTLQLPASPTGLSETHDLGIYIEGTTLHLNGVPADFRVQVFDISGRKCLDHFNQSEKLDISTLAAGMYTLQLSGMNQVITKKFVKR